MIEFLVLAGLLQAFVQFVRERWPRLDGAAVVGVAILLGMTTAYFLPAARVLDAFTGAEVSLFTNVIASGVFMGLGAKWGRDFIKGLSTSLEKPGTPANPEP